MGAFTFTGSVTNNGILHVQNGSVLESYGPFVNNGIIDLMDGTTNFHSTFINNGIIVSADRFWTAVGEGWGAHTTFARRVPFTAQTASQSGVSPVPRQPPHCKRFATFSSPFSDL